MDFFHLSGALLATGSVVAPGNWGRVIRAAQWTHTQAIREMALEAARIARFPGCPSRLDSAFMFPTRAEADSFRAANGAFGFHLLYRVTLMDRNVVTAMTDWRLMAPTGILRYDWADAYWQTMVSLNSSIAIGIGEYREVLTLSPIKIEERLN
jgi:hypothetical protein